MLKNSMYQDEFWHDNIDIIFWLHLSKCFYCWEGGHAVWCSIEGITQSWCVSSSICAGMGSWKQSTPLFWDCPDQVSEKHPSLQLSVGGYRLCERCSSRVHNLFFVYFFAFGLNDHLFLTSELEGPWPSKCKTSHWWKILRLSHFTWHQSLRV